MRNVLIVTLCGLNTSSAVSCNGPPAARSLPGRATVTVTVFDLPNELFGFRELLSRPVLVALFREPRLLVAVI